MLRTVACILREIFGEEDSYRIGGDEFVAFALDSTDTELNENMEQFVRQVEEAGYSVAVGTASHLSLIHISPSPSLASTWISLAST